MAVWAYCSIRRRTCAQAAHERSSGLPPTNGASSNRKDGVFRPLQRPKGLAEHHHVTLTVDIEEQVPALAEVSGSLSVEDAQELREIIEREFERVDPREW